MTVEAHVFSRGLLSRPVLENGEGGSESGLYLMCPHEILTVRGYSLEDYYGGEWEKRYLECIQDSRISKRVIS